MKRFRALIRGTRSRPETSDEQTDEEASSVHAPAHNSIAHMIGLDSAEAQSMERVSVTEGHPVRRIPGDSSAYVEEIEDVDQGIRYREMEKCAQSEDVLDQQESDVGTSSRVGDSCSNLDVVIRIDSLETNLVSEELGAGNRLEPDGSPLEQVSHSQDSHVLPPAVLKFELGPNEKNDSKHPPVESLTAEKPRENVIIEIPKESGKLQELESYKGLSPLHTAISNLSENMAGDFCRICQQHTEEPLMDLGCQCRGELSRAHGSCIEHWFGNKGTNKCEVCQHVATNVPAPATQPTPHFWVWRDGGPYGSTGPIPRRIGGVGLIRINALPMRPVLLMTLRRHPSILLLWVLLFAFMAYLFVDVTDSASIGYAAMPIGFLFGVLVVLGLGTAARLVLECWHERVIQRNIRQMEEEPNFEDFPVAGTNVHSHTDSVQDRPPFSMTPLPPSEQGSTGASHMERA